MWLSNDAIRTGKMLKKFSELFIKKIDEQPTVDVLDKIRAEIKQEYDNQGDWSFNDGLAFALDIIDKYTK